MSNPEKTGYNPNHPVASGAIPAPPGLFPEQPVEQPAELQGEQPPQRPAKLPQEEDAPPPEYSTLPQQGEQSQTPYFAPPPGQGEKHQLRQDVPLSAEEEKQRLKQQFPPPPAESSSANEKRSEQQHFPPPPPGPPPVHQQYDEKKNFPPPPPGPPPVQGQQGASPHPSPLMANPVQFESLPPQGQQQGQNQGQQPQQQQQQQSSYTIPVYNPASPTFAPPPTSEQVPAAETQPHAQAHPEAHHQPQPHAQAHSEAHHQPQPQAYSQAHPSVGAHETQEQPPKKQGWSERLTSLGMKAAAPINSLAHKLGSQSFLPETLDKESDKAASILRAFCTKGVYADPAPEQPPTSTDPKATEKEEGIIDPTKEKPKSKVIVTIPPKVISRAVGLAIFTTLRAGFNVSGATGSGILIARLPDGSWGPPSGIQVHSVGGGFLVGLDIYDCVCVINSREALAAFTNARVSLGSDLAVVAGPYGAGGSVEFPGAIGNSREGREKETGASSTEAKPEGAATDNQNLKPEKDDKKQKRSSSASSFKPVFSYVKSRGFYAGVQIDGTVVVERKEANAAFYGSKVSVEQIIKGEVPPQGPSGMWPSGARLLLETLEGAEAGMLREKPGKGGFTPAAGGPSSGPSAGPTASPVAGSSGNGGQPPAYVDDGLARPGVGDYKYR